MHQQQTSGRVTHDPRILSAHKMHMDDKNRRRQGENKRGKRSAPCLDNFQCS